MLNSIESLAGNGEWDLVLSSGAVRPCSNKPCGTLPGNDYAPGTKGAAGAPGSPCGGQSLKGLGQDVLPPCGTP